jgi:hypothetical protein
MKLSEESRYRLRTAANLAAGEFTPTALEALAAELGALSREIRKQACEAGADAAETETEGGR